MVLKPNAVVDIAKQGPQLQNLTGMWNARVLDGFTPFVVQFKENGLPVNLTDLNAFIEGDIGEGHYDSATDDIVMTGTPKSVRYTDDGSGNTNLGIVVFRLPPQFFFQTGIFKGFIGLQSSTGIRSTSNDVWFKVLGNSYTMGISCKYFISDFQKALDQANGKITQALNDLYNKYNQKAGQAESNLDNFLSTLKNEQKAADDLSMLIKQTNDYINTHNVVTKNEYDKLANEIVTKLGQINVTPNYYKNYDDMVANNPNGTENLCVTADTEHKWLYVNEQWLDLGNFSYAAIDPQLKIAMLTPNSSNVLPNSDFKLDDYWSASSNSKEYTLENVIERFKSYNGSYYFKVSGDSIDAKVSRWLISDNIAVNNNTYMSLGFKGTVNSDGTNAHVDIHFLDKDKNEIDQKKFFLNNNTEFKYFKFENIQLPANTVFISVGFTAQGTGIIEGTQPQINFDKVLLPYDSKDTVNQTDETYTKIENEIISLPNDNSLPNADLKTDNHWTVGSIGSKISINDVIDRSKSYINSYYFKVSGDSIDAKVPRWLISDNIAVNNNTYMSLGFKGTVNSDGTNAHVDIHFLDKDKNEIDQKKFFLNNNTEFKYFKFENIQLPANTVFISVGFTAQGTGIIEGTQPQVSFTKVLLPYSVADSSSKKLPQLRIYLDGAISSDWTNSRFTYVDGNKDLAGFVQIAWQGDSSRNYPKKNYKTKFFEDSSFKNKLKWKPKPSWASNNKFNLKANWIDATHARNLTNAKLFAKATAVTPFANADVAKKLSASQNFGQMEGFPIEVYINNDYQGLYTLNTKKDEKTFNMSDKIAGEEALEFENSLGADLTIDEKNVSTIVQDKPNDELQNNFTKFVKFINDSSDDDFKAHLQDYIDVKSVMNQYLFGVLAQEWDYYSKSYLLLTYNNGKYWYLTQYDLDSTWDIYWNGTQDPRETSFDLSAKELGGFVTGGSTLYSRVYKLFKQELQEQYKYLRSTVWRNDELIKPFKEFIDSIPSEVYKHDQTIWTNIPSKDFTSYGQLQSTILRRASEMDQFVNNTFEPIDTK